jgi:hypothetical protein
MITPREWLQLALRRRLPDWAQVNNIRYWQEMLERLRLESMPAGSDLPEHLLFADPVRRAIERDTGVPLEALEEEEPWRGYRDADESTLTVADAAEEENGEDRTSLPRARAAGRGDRAYRDWIRMMRPRVLDPVWEDPGEDRGGE